MNKPVNPPGYPVHPFYSQAVESTAAQRMLFIAGQVGVGADGTIPADITGQTMNALNNLSAVLTAGGMTSSDTRLVVSLTSCAESRSATSAVTSAATRGATSLATRLETSLVSRGARVTRQCPAARPNRASKGTLMYSECALWIESGPAACAGRWTDACRDAVDCIDPTHHRFDPSESDGRSKG